MTNITKFDIDNYNKSLRRVELMIKKSLPNWETTEGFVLDGVKRPEVYAKQKTRIACFLSETYGFDECCCWIEDPQTSDWGLGNHQVKSVKRLAGLIWLIQQYIENNKKIEFQDIPAFLNKNSVPMLKDALDKVAWINTKKLSRHIDGWGNGATNQNEQEVYDHTMRNKEILKEQILSANPDILIVCGKVVFNGMHDAGLLGDGVSKHKKKIFQRNSSGQKIIELSHPSYHRDWGYRGIYQTFEIIQKGLSTD